MIYPIFFSLFCCLKNADLIQKKVPLTLKARIATKVVCSNVLEASMANSVDPDQTAPIGAVCSGSTLFASILNSSVMLGNYLQQMTLADDIFRHIFFFGALRVNVDLVVWNLFSSGIPSCQPLVKCKRAFQALINIAVEELCEVANSLIAPVRLGAARPTATFPLVSANVEAVQVGVKNFCFFQCYTLKIFT